MAGIVFMEVLVESDFLGLSQVKSYFFGSLSTWKLFHGANKSVEFLFVIEYIATKR